MSEGPAGGDPAGGENADADDGVARGSAAGLGWTIASRATGFVRVAAVGAVLGPTYLGNTFQAVNVLPNLVFYLTAGSLIPALLVPLLAGALADGDHDRVQRLARGATGIAAAAFTAVAVVAAALSPLLVRLLSATVDDAAVAADQRRVGTLLLLFVLPQVPLYAIAGVGVAVQHAHRRFGLAAGAPVLENLGLVATLVAVAVLYGTGRSLGETGTAQAVVLGVGSTAAVALHAGAQCWGAARAGVRLLPGAGWREPELRGLGRMIAPSATSTGGNVVKEFALLVATNAIAGGVVAFQVAYGVYNLVAALSARPVAAATLPVLSALHHRADERRFRSELGRAWALVVVLAVPAAVVSVVLAGPLGSLLALGDMARGDGPRLVAAALAGLAGGMVFDALFTMGQQAAFARRNAGPLAVAQAARVGLTLVGLAVVSGATDGATSSVIGVGVAVVVGDVVGAGLLWSRVTRGLPRDARGRQSTVRAVVASLVMTPPALVAAELTTRVVPGVTGERLAAVTGGGTALVGLLLTLHLLGSPELRDWRSGVRRPA